MGKDRKIEAIELISGRSINKYLGQYFFIVYTYSFNQSKPRNAIIKDQHPLEWLTAQRGAVIINYFEITRDLYYKVKDGHNGR